MTDDQRERRTSSLAVWLIVAAVLLPVAYVLSLGPAVRFTPRVGWWPNPIVVAIYKPLVWLGDCCPPLGDALRWYVSLWQG
jgi:hypothetical protein